tara:strand:- start:6641 stop:7813 length:1173 start_codon:yes stop_codon:yes gene_type:complete
MTSKTFLTLVFIGLYSLSYSQSKTYREHEINSEFLKEKRIINVGLPKNYDANKKYPFVYVLDGEYIFDYAKAALGMLADFEVSIPNSIVIGISNTARFKDLGLPRNAKRPATHINFLNFIEKELFPLIEKNYGTQKFKILYGWSLGAQFSASIFSTRVDLFDGYIVSGFLQNKYLHENYFNTLPKNIKTHKYLYGSIEGIDIISFYPNALEYFGKYKTVFSDISELTKLKVKFKNEETLNHDQVFMTSFKKGMRFIFSDFFDNLDASKNLTLSNDELLDSYTNTITTYYNNSFSIPESVFVNKAYAISSSDKSDDAIIQAISILKKGLTIHGNSTELLHSISMYNLLNKNFIEAEAYHEKVLKNELNSNNKLQYITEYKRVHKRVSAKDM